MPARCTIVHQHAHRHRINSQEKAPGCIQLGTELAAVHILLLTCNISCFYSVYSRRLLMVSRSVCAYKIAHNCRRFFRTSKVKLPRTQIYIEHRTKILPNIAEYCQVLIAGKKQANILSNFNYLLVGSYFLHGVYRRNRPVLSKCPGNFTKFFLVAVQQKMPWYLE